MIAGRVRRVAERVYADRLRHRVTQGEVPRHLAVVMDGNRRWARQAGLASATEGHRAGARHLAALLRWCAAAGVEHVTVFVASAGNLARRDADEVAGLMRLMEEVVATEVAEPAQPWAVSLAGRVDLLPDSTRLALKQACDHTAARPYRLTLAVGYGGRAEVVDAVRRLLEDAAHQGRSVSDVAAQLSPDDIAARLYTRDLPDVDLIIRTSGEQRLSDFLIWQSADAELFFCDAHWPAFREVDLLRALRDFSRRRAGR